MAAAPFSRNGLYQNQFAECTFNIGNGMAQGMADGEFLDDGFLAHLTSCFDLRARVESRAR